MKYYNVSRKRAIELIEYIHSEHPEGRRLPVEMTRKEAEIYK